MAIPKFLWPIVSTGVEYKLRCWETGGGITLGVMLPAGTYYMSGDGTATDVLQWVQDTMNGGGVFGPGAVAVSATSAGRITIVHLNIVETITMEWSFDATTRALAALLGFDYAADDVIPFPVAPDVTTTLTSDHQHQYGWYPEIPPRSYTHVRPGKVVTSTRAKSGKRRTHVQASRTATDIVWEFLAPEKIWATPVDGAGQLNEDAETGLWDVLSDGDPVRYYPSVAVPGTYTNVVHSFEQDQEWAEDFNPERVSEGLELYNWRMKLETYV